MGIEAGTGNVAQLGGMSAAAQSNAISAAGSLAVSAISTWNSHKLDKIRYKMQAQQKEFQDKTAFENRQFQSWIATGNREKLRASLASEKLALEIDTLVTRARIENQASAAGISNVSGVVRDFQKSALRKEMYQNSTHVDKLEASRMAIIDTQRTQTVRYDPAPAQSRSSAFAQFGIDAFKIGKTAFGPAGKG